MDVAAWLHDLGLDQYQVAFEQNAIETCFAWGQWDTALAHAEALAQYTRVEPTPFTTLVVERARALVAYRRGRRDAALAAEFERLKSAAMHMDFITAMDAIDDAMARWNGQTR